jgi:tetratricopeptide (TPR) repeat protein
MKIIQRPAMTWFAALAVAAGLAWPGSVALAGVDDLALRTTSFAGAYLAGRVAETDEDLDAAIAFYRRALDIQPDNQELERALMLALIARGRFEEALPHAERLKTVPEVEKYSRLALAVDAIRKGAFGEAEILLKIAMEFDLDRLISGLMTAWVKAGAGDAAGALAHVEELEGPEWYTLFTSFHRALIAEVTGRTAEADAAYEALLADKASGGTAPDVYLRAAEAYARLLAGRGDREAALAVLDRAEEFLPGRLQIAKLREDIEGGETIRPLVGSVAAGAGEVLLDVATALNRSGGESFVRLYLQYARVLLPRHDAVLIQLAQVAEQQQKAEEAIAYYRQVPADSPVKRVAELQLGLNLADLDRFDEAIRHLKALVEEDPDDMRAYLALGGVYAAKEDYRSAAELFDRAVARIGKPQREHWMIFYRRGIAYERLKEWDKAEPNFRTALELYPDEPQVLNYLGYSWVDMNMNLEEGLEMIRKAVELRPNDGYIVDSLGWAYYRLGRFEEAVEALERAVSLRPEDPILNDHLGDAYWRVGRRLEAIFQWTHARDLDPDEALRKAVEKKLAEGLPPLEEKRAGSGAEEPAGAAVTASAPQAAATVGLSSPARSVEHVVQPGQSLWSIAEDHLGDGSLYPAILELNPQLRGSPGSIRPGQRLMLPAPAE